MGSESVANRTSQLLESISFKLFANEDGDLLTTSEIIDNLKELAELAPANHPAQKLIETLTMHAASLLNGADFEQVSRTCAQSFLLLENVLRVQGGTPNSDAAPVEKTADEPVAIQTHSDVFQIFLSEAGERLIKAQDLILKLEANPTEKGVADELFRVFHTIKGECGFLKVASLGEVAHNLENMLELVKSGRLAVDQHVIEAFLEGIDHSTRMIDALTKGNIVIFNSVNIDDFKRRVGSLVHDAKPPIGDMLVRKGKLSELEVAHILQKQKESSYTKKFGEIAIEGALIEEAELEDSLESQKGRESEALKTDQIIKVRASQVNYLVDMVGELIIAESQLPESGATTQLRKIARQIQYASMQLRTEKVSYLFLNMKRVARDVAKKLEKKVTVELKGEALEVDRNLVEKLDEPLIHLVRNAVSHGIEPAEERSARGKAPEGLITLRAERLGNSVVISVEDDGRGMNKDRILEKAIAEGIITQNEAPRLKDDDIWEFVFRPGFSTAEKVDFVSGRGVGMDVVKQTVTTLRGRIQIKTEKGGYTKIMLIFPLSTAIIDGMIVQSGGTLFIIPVTNVIESLRAEAASMYKVKEQIDVIDLRQEVIPVVRLRDFFNQKTGDKGGNTIAVIVENSQKHKFALLVDAVITKREVFVKSLGSKFKELAGISSGTILQGGKVGFVLDVEQIVSGIGRPV